MKQKEFNFWKWFASKPPIAKLLKWAKVRSFPGFGGIPAYDIFRFVIRESIKDNISTRANSMAFSFFIALFPAVIFVFTLLPLFPITLDYVEAMRESLTGVLPESAEEYIFGIVENLVSIPRGGLFTLGFALALIFSSNGIASMMKGFEKSYEGAFKPRGYFQRFWTAIKLTILLTFLLVMSTTLIVLGKVVINYLFTVLSIEGASRVFFNTLRWIFVVALYHAVISSIYRFGAPTIKKFHFYSPGATVATIFMVIVSLAFAYFVNNFGTYNEIYGSIGALIVILVWIQFNCTILLIGYEINASIAVNKALISEDNE